MAQYVTGHDDLLVFVRRWEKPATASTFECVVSQKAKEG